MKIAELPLKRVKLTDIVTDTYNPRAPISLEYKEYLRKNITDPNIGFLEPLVINVNPDRLNTLISGHVRLTILQEEGYEEVDVSTVNVDETKEKELNIAFNKVRAEFDPLKLQELPPDVLTRGGFSPLELEELGKLDFSELDDKLKGASDELVNYTTIAFKVHKDDEQRVRDACEKFSYNLKEMVEHLTW